jgi:putative membrane protein
MSFYKDAAEGGMAEVQDANLAQQKATNPEVKDFAARMIKDHTAADDKLMSLAASKNITLPGSPGLMDKAGKAKLDMESGDTFDKGYIKSQLSAHRDAIKLFRKESQTGQDPEAKAFAQSTLPTLESHLHEAEKVARDLGVSTK